MCYAEHFFKQLVYVFVCTLQYLIFFSVNLFDFCRETFCGLLGQFFIFSNFSIVLFPSSFPSKCLFFVFPRSLLHTSRYLQFNHLRDLTFFFLPKPKKLQPLLVLVGFSCIKIIIQPLVSFVPNLQPQVNIFKPIFKYKIIFIFIYTHSNTSFFFLLINALAFHFHHPRSPSPPLYLLQLFAFPNQSRNKSGLESLHSFHALLPHVY